MTNADILTVVNGVLENYECRMLDLVGRIAERAEAEILVL